MALRNPAVEYNVAAFSELSFAVQWLACNWDIENCSLYGVAESPLFRGCLSTEVSGMTVGTFRSVRYIVGVRFSGVSVKQCLERSGECGCCIVKWMLVSTYLWCMLF